MTSPQQLNAAQRRVRFDTLQALSEVVTPLVQQSTFTEVMGALDQSLRFSNDGAVRYEIGGITYDQAGDAIRAFFEPTARRAWLAPGASLPGSSLGTQSISATDSVYERTLHQLRSMGRTDAFQEGPPPREPRLDSPDPCERAAAQIRALEAAEAAKKPPAPPAPPNPYRFDSPDPGERTLARLHQLGRYDAFRQ